MRTFATGRLLGFSLLLCLAVPGCTARTEVRSGTNWGDTLRGDAGGDGGAVQSCASNNDCVEVCIAGRCAPASGPGGPCDEPADCTPGLVCDPSGCIQTVVVEPVYPLTGLSWNDYVKNDDPGQDRYHQDDVACDGTETGGPTVCVHGGEAREVVVSALSSCAGLSLIDDLGAFSWVCQDTGGVVTFYSSGLAPTKGLKHLVTSAGFLQNAVTVQSGSDVVARSAPAVWGWANTFAPLPDNSTDTSVELDGVAGTIYVLDTSRASNGYTITTNDKIAVVLLDEVTISHGGSTTTNCSVPYPASLVCQVAAGGRRFLWVEGDFDATDSTAGNDADANLVITDVQLSRFHQFRGHSAYFNSMELVGAAQSNWFSDLTLRDAYYDPARASSATGCGIYVHDSAQPDDNVFSNLVIEGTDNAAIYWRAGDRNLFRDVSISRCRESNGIDGSVYFTANGNRFYNISVTKSGRGGLDVSGSGNVVVNAVLANNGFWGLRTWRSTALSEDNVYVNILSVNNRYEGIYPDSMSTRFTISHVFSLNNGDPTHPSYPERCSAVRLRDAAGSHTLNHIVAAGSCVNGLRLVGGGGSDSNRINNLVAAHNQGGNILLSNTEDNEFLGNIWVSEDTGNCTVSGSTSPGLEDQTCTNSGAEDSSSYASSPQSSAVLHKNVSLAGSFLGEVTTTDQVNGSNTAGVQAEGAITDWYHFENPFRAWGKSGASFPDPSLTGYCNTGTCQIWDWRLRASDAALREVNGVLINDAPCPASADGSDPNSVLTDQHTTPNVFLANATEVVLDGIGDEDGLCESNEACIYSPNIGLYQGEGDYTTQTCTFQGGIVSNVTMYAYPINGR